MFDCANPTCEARIDAEHMARYGDRCNGCRRGGSRLGKDRPATPGELGVSTPPRRKPKC